MKLTLLIPVRNEGINIKIMLKILSVVLDCEHEIVIVYDDKSDDCLPVVQSLQPEFSHVKCVHNNQGKGIIKAIQAGVDAASGEYVLLMAVDDLGPVLAIGDMVKFMDQGCDLVSATRYSNNGKRLGGSLIGGFLSRLANRLFSLLSGSRLADATTGMKMFRKSRFNELNLESNPVGWAVVFEIAIKAQHAGFKLGEVPIVSIDRIYGGESTFALGPWVKEYLRWFFWGFKNLDRKRSESDKVLKAESRYR